MLSDYLKYKLYFAFVRAAVYRKHPVGPPLPCCFGIQKTQVARYLAKLPNLAQMYDAPHALLGAVLEIGDQ